MSRTLTVATTRADLRAAQQRQHLDVGLVMTMGALHDGHAALIRAARAQHRTVVVTVFVNPLQFSPAEDFARYPRPLDADVALCAREGVDLVFAPEPTEVYRGEQRVTVAPGPLANQLEGAIRPGHFAGVLTVVHKMLNIIGNVDTAYFGEKDYQQLTLVRQMAYDLDLAPAIAGAPTVREADGLALSSRNVYLGDPDRRAATALPDALFAGAAAAATGGTAKDVLAVAGRVLADEPRLAVDYLQLRSPELTEAPPAGPARLLAAVRAGRTRLIDNVAVTLGGTAAVPAGES